MIGICTDTQSICKIACCGQYCGGTPSGAFTIQVQRRINTSFASYSLDIRTDVFFNEFITVFDMALAPPAITIREGASWLSWD